MVVVQLQVANSPRVLAGTCGTCYVTTACICTMCNDLYYVNSFTILFIILYTSYMNVFIYLAVCTGQIQMHIRIIMMNSVQTLQLDIVLPQP